MIENTTSPEDLEEMRLQFKQMDVDGDGVLSKEEITDGIKDTGVILTKKQIDEIFLYHDKDGSGCIDYNEFIIILADKSKYQKEEKIRSIT